MRPVEVTIEGLRSFRRLARIDFAGRELVAIIGDTGAGKSSILEALTWALYGNATWTKQAGVLLGDGCAQMRVRLVFEADGNRWQVTRAVKRRQDGSPGPASAELVCLDGDRPAVDGVRQVNPAIERLLGLDWDAFTRTVVLPQGQFARLLTEGDVDRMRILSQIWRTDELVAARGQADEALRQLAAHLEFLRGRRGGYPDDVAAELQEARRTANQAEQAARAADAAVDEARRCRQAAEQAARRAAGIRGAATQAESALAGDAAAEASRLLATAAALQRRLGAIEEGIGEQERQVAELAGADEDGGADRAATRRAVATLDSLAASLDDLAGCLRRIRELRAAAGETRGAAERLQSEADDAEARARSAEQDVARWRRVDAAATAAHGLHPGDHCPVCARGLPDGWDAPDASGLQRAVAALDAARADARGARDRQREMATEARQTAAQVGQETVRLDQRLQSVAAAVAALPRPFRPALPQPFTVAALGPDDLAEALVSDARTAAHARAEQLEARDAELRTAQDLLHGLREQRTGLRERHHDDVVRPATRLRARLERICERLRACADAGVELPLVVPELGEAAEQLADDARAVTVVAGAALDAARAAARQAEGEAARQEANLARLLAAATVGSVEALADRQARLRADAKQARDRADELERIAPVVAALDDHLVRGDQAAGALRDLKTLLQDGRFIRWLTLRRSRALLAVASTLLAEITGGRYAFADITDEHDEWRVFDTGTGYARSPRTLSGGESFVASLALALGMVEMVARSGGRLDALFLDEGFGALDRDNLDAAIDALESSATRGRMVAVISHVQAVAERLPDVLAVDRSASGSAARWLSPAEREGVALADLTGSVGNLLD